MAHNVCHALNKTIIHSPLAMVITPSALGETHQEYHQKVELETACLAEVGHHFTQACNTPLLLLPVYDIFGETGRAKEVTQVLEGTFTLPPVNLYIQKFFQAVARPISVANITPQNLDSYRWEWQKVWETTGSLQSGIHFGHYIVGTFNPEILVINVTLVDIPLKAGFMYDHWKKGLNIMIEKTIGDFNVEKLHIILLFEADFNANNKWIGHAVMYQAEQQHLLADEQYGSCKFKLAIHQCLNKQFFNDLVCFKHCLAVLCSNDAKSCYDCISLLVATLCLC